VLILLSVGLLAVFLLWGFQDIEAAPALQANLGAARWLIVAVAAAIAALPAVAARVNRLIALLESPSPARRRAIAISIAVVATLYLIATAHLQGRDLFAKTHDDQSYLIQMQMLARFRLWMPQHPLADFFDTFYVIGKPVYASLYFPGAAMLYVPTIWLDLPTWLMPACAAGACVGLLYRIIAEVVDGASALLASLALVSLEYFRVFSVLLTSHEPMLLLGLLLTWAWLRWRRSERRWPWALAMGIFAAWGAITRPADAVCFALPVGLMMLLDLVRPGAKPPESLSSFSPVLPAEQTHRATVPAAAGTIGLLIVGAAPFLALQAWFNKGVTGSYLQTPYTYYLQRDQPNTSFGFHAYDPSVRPTSTNRKKHDYYDQFFARYILRHQPGENLVWWGRVYLPMTVDTTLPTRLALPLAFVGLLLVRNRARLAIVGVLPLFLVLYYFNTFFLEHYAILVAPAMLLLVVLGVRQVSAAWRARAGAIRSALTVGLAACCLLILPEFNPLWSERHQSGDETRFSSKMQAAKLLPQADDLLKPAVVLFTYRFGDALVDEPVYNTDVAWPDDATVIYAHDLRERNREIFDYYARTQPQRHFYRFDLGATPAIEYLGRADQLGRK